MTDQPKRTNFWMWVSALFFVWFVIMAYLFYDSNRELSEKKTQDSVHYRQVVGVVSRLNQENESLKSALGASDSARVKDAHNFLIFANAQANENRKLKRALAAVNTSRASVPELDSMQRSLYGEPPDDSLHTIPLDYSRKLTGDALRLPIEQRLATLWETRYDSLEAHSGRLIGSYKLDLEMYRQHTEDATATIDTLHHIAGDMQGVINDKSEENDKLRKGRNRERLIGLALIITALIL